MEQLMHSRQIELLKEKHENWAYGAPPALSRVLSELQFKSGGGIMDFQRYKADFLTFLQSHEPMLLDILNGSEKKPTTIAALAVYGYTAAAAVAGETAEQALQMFGDSYDARERRLFGPIYGSLNESAKDCLRMYITEHGMSSGSSAWGELEKQYVSQTDVGRQAALTALNSNKLTIDGDPQEYYQNLRLSAAAYDAMRTDGGKHCEDDFKRMVMANLPDQYKIIGNFMKYIGATTAGIIAAISDVWADTKSTVTPIRHERTAGVPGAMIAMAARAELPGTRKCIYEFCIRPNSKHTIEQCWDRRAALERFQTVTQSKQQQYSNYGAYPAQQQYASSHGSAVQQQYAPNSQHNVYQPDYYHSDQYSHDARQQQWFQPTRVQAQSAQPAANYAYTTSYPSTCHGGVAYAPATSSTGTEQPGEHVPLLHFPLRNGHGPLRFPVRNEQYCARDTYHGRAQKVVAIASYASHTGVQRLDCKTYGGDVSISNTLYDNIGNNNSGMTNNYELLAKR
jgi:hypothetical protein